MTHLTCPACGRTVAAWPDGRVAVHNAAAGVRCGVETWDAAEEEEA